MKRRPAVAALLAGALPAAAARTLQVARGDRLADAVAAARDGDTIELEAGYHHGQTAVVTQRRLTLRAAEGGRAVLLADGAQAEGKALVVVRGGLVNVEGIEFRGCRAPSGNGAGIRFESGVLRVRRCRFVDNEMGLLTANLATATLVIEDCDFEQAPRHQGLLHHLLYVGRIARLRLSGSRFSGGWRGHLVKSRAAVSDIVCNRLLDGESGESSYEIDLPNGGRARVQGNVVAQGAHSPNLTLVAFGAEGSPHPVSELLLSHNHLLNDADRPAAFVRHWPDRLPHEAVLRIEHNLFVGEAEPGSWGRAEDDNRLLPLAERARALAAPPCPAN
jgi:hypothetical protein